MTRLSAPWILAAVSALSVWASLVRADGPPPLQDTPPPLPMDFWTSAPAAPVGGSATEIDDGYVPDSLSEPTDDVAVDISATRAMLDYERDSEVWISPEVQQILKLDKLRKERVGLEGEASLEDTYIKSNQEVMREAIREGNRYQAQGDEAASQAKYEEAREAKESIDRHQARRHDLLIEVESKGVDVRQLERSLDPGGERK